MKSLFKAAERPERPRFFVLEAEILARFMYGGTMTNFYFPADLIPLAMTDDAKLRAKLEQQFGVAQDEAVTT